MTRIVLLAHAPLASALLGVAAHTYSECAAEVLAVDVQPEQTPADVETLLRQRLTAGPDGAPTAPTLILVDVFGATPCNGASRLADGQLVRVVAGVNVPMLWRTICYRHESLDALVERAVTGAVQGAMQVAAAPPQQQRPLSRATAHDHEPRRDQQ